MNYRKKKKLLKLVKQYKSNRGNINQNEDPKNLTNLIKIANKQLINIGIKPTNKYRRIQRYNNVYVSDSSELIKFNVKPFSQLFSRIMAIIMIGINCETEQIDITINFQWIHPSKEKDSYNLRYLYTYGGWQKKHGKVLSYQR